MGGGDRAELAVLFGWEVKSETIRGSKERRGYCANSSRKVRRAGDLNEHAEEGGVKHWGKKLRG